MLLRLHRTFVFLLLPLLVTACTGVRLDSPRTEDDVLAVWLRHREAAQPMPAHAPELISTVMGLIGTPYLRGGGHAATGFDCSGFVRSVYAESTGHQLPRIARDQARVTTTIAKKDLQPGDLVFFNTLGRAYSHVGIYVGDGNFVHSPRSGAAVRIENMKARYWASRFNGARRVPLRTTAQSDGNPSLHAGHQQLAAGD